MMNPNPSSDARALVLAGPALALLATVFCLATEVVGRLLGGGAGSVQPSGSSSRRSLASYGGGFAAGVLGNFRSLRTPRESGERFGWATRNVHYAWRRDLEEHEFQGQYPGAPRRRKPMSGCTKTP